MKFLFFVIAFAVSINLCTAQKILKGIVKMSGNPIKGLTVYTPFATTETDSLGRYSLPLNGCAFCKIGNQIKVFTHNKAVGMSEQICTIGNDYTFDFSIARNPEKIFLTGVVENQENGMRLPGILVRFLMAADIDVQPVVTNVFGEFKIPLPKSYLENKNAVQLRVNDPSKRYKQVSNGQDLFDIGSFITIKMKSLMGKQVSVAGYTITTICYNKGDLVTLEASGNIRVGSFVGSSDPEGLAAGVMGMSLERYNIISNFKHAALMYRRVGESEWKVAGKYKRFYATESGGCLEFDINDSNQNDNEGAYEVTISIDKGG